MISSRLAIWLLASSLLFSAGDVRAQGGLFDSVFGSLNQWWNGDTFQNSVNTGLSQFQNGGQITFNATTPESCRLANAYCSFVSNGGLCKCSCNAGYRLSVGKACYKPVEEEPEVSIARSAPEPEGNLKPVENQNFDPTTGKYTSEESGMPVFEDAEGNRFFRKREGTVPGSDTEIFGEAEPIALKADGELKETGEFFDEKTNQFTTEKTDSSKPVFRDESGDRFVKDVKPSTDPSASGLVEEEVKPLVNNEGKPVSKSPEEIRTELTSQRETAAVQQSEETFQAASELNDPNTPLPEAQPIENNFTVEKSPEATELAGGEKPKAPEESVKIGTPQAKPEGNLVKTKDQFDTRTGTYSEDGKGLDVYQDEKGNRFVIKDEPIEGASGLTAKGKPEPIAQQPKGKLSETEERFNPETGEFASSGDEGLPVLKDEDGNRFVQPLEPAKGEDGRPDPTASGLVQSGRPKPLVSQSGTPIDKTPEELNPPQTSKEATELANGDDSPQLQGPPLPPERPEGERPNPPKPPVAKGDPELQGPPLPPEPPTGKRPGPPKPPVAKSDPELQGPPLPPELQGQQDPEKPGTQPQEAAELDAEQRKANAIARQEEAKAEALELDNEVKRRELAGTGGGTGEKTLEDLEIKEKELEIQQREEALRRTEEAKREREAREEAKRKLGEDYDDKILERMEMDDTVRGEAIREIAGNENQITELGTGIKNAEQRGKDLREFRDLSGVDSKDLTQEQRDRKETLENQLFVDDDGTKREFDINDEIATNDKNIKDLGEQRTGLQDRNKQLADDSYLDSETRSRQAKLDKDLAKGGYDGVRRDYTKPTAARSVQKYGYREERHLGNEENCRYSSSVDKGGCETTDAIIQTSQVMDAITQVGGQLAVGYEGQRQQLRASSEGTQAAALDAAAETAELTYKKEMVAGGINVTGALTQFMQWWGHGSTEDEFDDVAQNSTDVLSGQAGQQGDGSSGDGFIEGRSVGKNDTSAAKDRIGLADTIVRRFKLNEEKYEISMDVVEHCQGLTGSQKLRCEYESGQARQKEFDRKMYGMEGDVQYISRRAAGEQRQYKKKAGMGAFMSFLKGAQNLATGFFAKEAADDLRKSANDLRNQAPGQNPNDPNFRRDPLDEGSGEAPRGGTTLTGQTAAASEELEEEFEEGGDDDLGVGFLPDGNDDSLSDTIQPSAFDPSLAGNPGGGGGGGSAGLGGGGTSAASTEDPSQDPPAYANLREGGGGYEAGGRNRRGRGGRGGGGGGGGLDFKSLVGQLFNQQQQDKGAQKNILSYGPRGRMPASLLGKTANFFVNVSQRYRKKEISGDVGI